MTAKQILIYMSIAILMNVLLNVDDILYVHPFSLRLIGNKIFHSDDEKHFHIPSLSRNQILW